MIVVIATNGRDALLRRTLRSLAECEPPREFQKTLIVENGPQGITRETVRTAPSNLKAEYLYCSVPNKCAALNAALRSVGSEFILFLDDDVRVSKNLLVAYSEIVEQWPNAFFGGPTLCDYDVVPDEWMILPPSARGWSAPEGTITISTPSFLGFNWAAHAESLRRAGGFNDSIGPGQSTTTVGDETEMQSKLLALGLRAVYVPSALVWHYVPRERCSIQWSLNRALQSGICAGFSAKHEVPLIFGRPRWMVRAAVGVYMESLIARLKNDRRKWYLAKYKLMQFRGHLKGYCEQNRVRANGA